MNPVGPASSFGVDAFVAGTRYATAANAFFWQDVYQPGSRPTEATPAVQIDRPVAFVPGWGGWGLAPERFQPVWEGLTAEGANGGRPVFVQDGRFFADRRATVPLQDVGRDDRVFVVVFSDPHAPPEASAKELGHDLEAIRRATGRSKVDLDAFSLGGLIARLYLDRGGEGVGKLLMVGTPNQGTRFAELARDVLARDVLARDVRWAMALSGISGADLPALDWLRAGSPELRDLNQGWERQRSRTEEVEVVGGGGLLTPTGASEWLLPAGDALVPEASLGLPGVRSKVLPGRHHMRLAADLEVQRQRAAFFGWKT